MVKIEHHPALVSAETIGGANTRRRMGVVIRGAAANQAPDYPAQLLDLPISSVRGGSVPRLKTAAPSFMQIPAERYSEGCCEPESRRYIR